LCLTLVLRGPLYNATGAKSFLPRLVPALGSLISRKGSDAPENTPDVPKSFLIPRNYPVSVLNWFSPLDWSSLFILYAKKILELKPVTGRK
jgi:hypothetical protein